MVHRQCRQLPTFLSGPAIQRELLTATVIPVSGQGLLKLLIVDMILGEMSLRESTLLFYELLRLRRSRGWLLQPMVRVLDSH